jgi:hypothetical protein
MKYLLLLLLFYTTNINSQIIIYEYCFDQGGNCADYDMSDPEPILTIDIASNPNNIWQIAQPQKTVFNAASSFPNVIITDSVDFYPINDTSSFIIESVAQQSSSSVNWANFNLTFNYFVDSDTLSDFGSIEFSPDNGSSWIDLINDSFYSGYLEWSQNGIMGITPILTGSSDGWKEASLNMRSLGEFLDIQPGTTFKWRFSFVSDAIQINRDGLMYDNIYVEITPPIGIQEYDSNPLISISPNPFCEKFSLKGTSESGEIVLLDLTGNEILRQNTIEGESKISTENYPSGLYLVYYMDGDQKFLFKQVKL